MINHPKIPSDGFIVKKYLKRLSDNRIQCLLCPNDCIIAEGQSGICRTRRNIRGELHSIVYGYPYGMHVDPIEKKPLYHFFPGKEILSFGTFGCNLFCKGCQNFDMTRADALKSIKGMLYYTPEEIVDIAIKNNVRMIAYTYNEPTIFFEYMIDVAKIARKKGIKNVIVSNGYINAGPLKELCRYIDAANIDIKGIREDFYKGYASAKLAPVLDTVEMLHKKKIWIELTNLIIPGLNDSTEDIKKLCMWIKKNVGNDVPLHFSRFYPHYRASDIRPTPEETLIKARDIARESGLRWVYVGNLGELDNTYCDRCHALLIDRETYRPSIRGLDIMKAKDRHTACKACHNHIPGIFSDAA